MQVFLLLSSGWFSCSGTQGADRKTVLTQTAKGRLYRSADEGKSWNDITDKLREVSESQLPITVSQIMVSKVALRDPIVFRSCDRVSWFSSPSTPRWSQTCSQSVPVSVVSSLSPHIFSLFFPCVSPSTSCYPFLLFLSRKGLERITTQRSTDWYPVKNSSVRLANRAPRLSLVMQESATSLQVT